MISVCTPVLAIEKVDGISDELIILAGNGCSVDSYKKCDGKLTLQRRTMIFEEKGYNIYGLSYRIEKDVLIAYGERELAVIWFFASSIQQKQIFSFNDWIQTLHIFSKQTEDGHSLLELATLSMNNTVHFLRLHGSGGTSNVSIQEVATVQSDYKATILYSILDGESWDTLRAIVGTVMGDIIISCPARSSAPSHILKNHTGMIFGLLIKREFLYSISDDRSLRMWSLNDAKHLNACYGHPTRPNAICDGPENVIFTGGQDGSICIWVVENASLSLLKLIDTGRGVIRSLLFISRELYFGTGCGFFGFLTFSANVKNMQNVNIIYSQLSVQSFVALSERCYFILDSKGALYATNGNTLKEILHCISARSDSLKLSPCRKYLALSAGKKLYVVRVEDYKCAYFNAGSQILDLFWVGDRLFLTLFGFENMMVDLVEDLSTWRTRSVQVNQKEMVSCVTNHSDRLYLGTRKGSVIVLQNFKMKQFVKCAHGKESVTDMKLLNLNLLTIGRDGKLCIWTTGSRLQLLSWHRPSAGMEMEWPCKFMVACNQLYVAGFHGRNFMVVNCDNGHCICDITCGGGHRTWHLSFPDKNPHLHVSGITSIALLRDGKCELYITGGVDAGLVMFKFGDAGSVEIMQRLPIHSSSVYSVCEKDNYLISAGGKSEIFICRLEEESLRQLFSTRVKGDCRLLSVRFISVGPCIRFLVSGSDGRLLMYELSSDMKSVERLRILLDSTNSQGIATKVSCISADDGHLICTAASSAGILHIWDFSESDVQIDYKTIEVEKCGLSALDMYNESEVLYVGVGSESGSVSIIQFENSNFVKCLNRWHSATCTDLRFHRTLQSFLVISVALDCRVAVFIYSPSQPSLIFGQSVLLNVSDPSSLIISPVNNNVSKCVIVGTSVCFLYIGSSHPFFLSSLFAED